MTDPRIRRTASRRSPSGFSLLEVLVSLLIVVLVLVAVLSLFDLNSRVARAQTQVAEMQQSLRVAQYTLLHDTRMAGRGGLPRGTLPGGLAVAVRNNAPASGDEHFIALGDAASPAIVEGSDVLTIRGVFSTPIYQVNPTPGTLILDDPVSPTSGSIIIQDPSATSGVPQDLEPLLQVLDNDLPDALILVSPVDSSIYAIVEITPGSCGGRSCLVDQTVTVSFTVSGGTHTAEYLALSAGGAFPPGLTSVAYVGLLEEHRFYVREEFAIPGDDTSDPAPRLARARFFPGTEVAYATDPVNLRNDIADNVLDLQLALAIDADGDGAILEDGTAADEWLFNAPDDLPGDERWNPPGGNPPPLFYVRISTLARTDRRQAGYVAPAIDGVEDRDYTETDPPADEADRQARMYHRRLLETVVDLRNIS